MATTQQKAAQQKKSEGFNGVRGAFWIIVVCAVVAFVLFFTWFGNDMHFQDPGTRENPADVWGTIFKGGVVVPVIHTLLLTVLAMSIERWLALKTAFGKGALPKFVANIKTALNNNDLNKANQLGEFLLRPVPLDGLRQCETVTGGQRIEEGQFVGAVLSACQKLVKGGKEELSLGTGDGWM